MVEPDFRGIAFHDTPLKGGYIVDILIRSTLFQSRRFLHVEKGSLQAYPLKAAVIQRLVRLEESRSLLVTLIVNLVNLKGRNLLP